MNQAPPSRDAALFLQLIVGLHQSGMISLGKLVNPVTGKVTRQLEYARDTIDTLAALESRTEGRLADDEARVLHHVLAELRLNYVDELKKPAAPAEPPPAEPHA
jgi:hypothetical protein